MNAKLFTAMGLAGAERLRHHATAQRGARECARGRANGRDRTRMSTSTHPWIWIAPRRNSALPRCSRAPPATRKSTAAYLAAQNARLAQAHGAAKADDARVAAGQAERDHIMLAARTREAENAKAAAANSQAVAAAAISQRDQANEDAAQAQQDAAQLRRSSTR